MSSRRDSTGCKEKVCWCHDDDAFPEFCSHCGCRSRTPQEELRQYLLDLGIPEEDIGDEEIPEGVLLIDNRPLTEAEREWARTILYE